LVDLSSDTSALFSLSPNFSSPSPMKFLKANLPEFVEVLTLMAF